jgi:hypothetical protein
LAADDITYLSLFDRFEYFLAMVYMDQSGLNGAPAGCFAWRQDPGDRTSPSGSIAREISEHRQNWPPLNAGMFGRSLKRALEVTNGLDDFILELAPSLRWG